MVTHQDCHQCIGHVRIAIDPREIGCGLKHKHRKEVKGVECSLTQHYSLTIGEDIGCGVKWSLPPLTLELGGGKITTWSPQG